MKHTPGKWEHRFCSHPDSGYAVFSNEIMVARIDNTVGEFNQEKANAHLIASAPKLYEITSTFANLTPDNWDRDNIETHLDMLKIDIELAKQAIAKAEGGNQ